MVSTVSNLLKTLLVIRGEVPRSSLQKDVGETVNLTQRCSQVVGHRITECLQLLIGGDEFRIASLHFGVQVLNLILYPFALCDVSYGAGNEDPLFCLKRAEADFYWELMTILVQTEQF